MVTRIVALYDEQCDVGTVQDPARFQGQEGARRFWTTYRDTFGDIESKFSLALADDRAAALEWTTEALVNGATTRYSGVTMLTHKGGAITRFCAYFDPAALGPVVQQRAGVDRRAPVEHDGWATDPQEMG